MRAIGCCDYCVRTGDTEENQRSWCGGAKRRSRSPLSPSTLPVASHHERDRLRCFGFNGGVDNILHFLAKTVLLNVFLNGHVFLLSWNWTLGNFASCDADRSTWRSSFGSVQ